MENEKLQQALKNLEEVNKTIANLDPVIKLSAFEALRSLIFGAPQKPVSGFEKIQDGEREDDDTPPAPIDTSSMVAFFSAIEKGKPVDNLYAIFAWFYSQRGTAAVSTEEVKAASAQIGLVIPARIDMSVKAAKYIQKVGKGFQPSVQGELYLQKTYNVSKGTVV